MSRVAWWLFALAVVGCTKPNPLDCSDGLCSDAEHPFCDVDGSFGGTANTCVAVTCTPKEPETCRGNVSVVCNAAGNNYDLVECERGCDPMHGCRQCVTNDECANPSPICDPESSACRTCKIDDECASKVCEAGSCVASSGILYALPNGSDSAMCTIADPCTISRAFSLAKNAGVSPIVRMLPGVYLNGIAFSGATALPLHVVATGATVSALTAISVSDGAKVEMRGITAVGNNFSVNCTSSSATRSEISFRDAVLRAGTSDANVITMDHCNLTLTTTELDVGGSGGTGIGTSSESSVIADRTHWHGTAVFSAGGFGSHIYYKVTNSILENVSLGWTTTDSTDPGSDLEFAFNTITVDGLEVDCQTNSGSPHRTRRFENNIVVGKNLVSVTNGSDCILTKNVLYPFTGPTGTNIVADPRFANAGSHDFHLQSGSPAIDAATPTIIPVSADYEGTQRPQGASSDIGALETHP